MTMTEPAHAALPVFPDENLPSGSLAKHAAAMGQDSWLIADATKFGLEAPDLDDLGLRPLRWPEQRERFTVPAITSWRRGIIREKAQAI